MFLQALNLYNHKIQFKGLPLAPGLLNFTKLV